MSFLYIDKDTKNINRVHVDQHFRTESRVLNGLPSAYNCGPSWIWLNPDEVLLTGGVDLKRFVNWVYVYNFP
jgi:hypothetical protein